MQPIDEAIVNAEHRPAAYVLSNSDRSYLYKGSCRNLQKRLKDHRAGRVSKTKNRRPLYLLHFEYCDSYTEARRRENWLKSGVGRKSLLDIS